VWRKCYKRKLCFKNGGAPEAQKEGTVSILLRKWFVQAFDVNGLWACIAQTAQRVRAAWPRTSSGHAHANTQLTPRATGAALDSQYIGNLPPRLRFGQLQQLGSEERVSLAYKGGLSRGATRTRLRCMMFGDYPNIGSCGHGCNERDE